MQYYVTIEGLDKRLNEITGVAPFDGTKVDLNYKLTNGQSLASMRAYALERTNGLLNLLGFSDYPQGLVDLNKKITEYQSATVLFNGPNLRANVINPIRGILNSQVNNTLKDFDNFLLQHTEEMQNTFLMSVERVAQSLNLDVTEKNYTAILNELFTLLNFKTVEGGLTLEGNVKTPTGGQLLSNADKELAKSALTQIRKGLMSISDPNFMALIKGPQANNRNFRKRLIDLAKNMGGIDMSWLEEYYTTHANITGRVIETDTNIALYTDFTGLYLENIKPFAKEGDPIAEKAAAAFFETKKGDAQFMQSLYDAAWSYFSKLLKTNDERLRGYFEEALHSIINQYPAAFFQGKNEQGVIGILGELQGLFYLYAILGENAHLNPKLVVQWIGGDTTQGGGVKTGADLIVKLGDYLGYGIQIKNSMDLTGSTNFSDFVLNSSNSLNGFIEQLSRFGLPQDSLRAIEDLLTMENFNIPYRLEGRRSVEGPPKGPYAMLFKDDRTTIEELYQQAHKLMLIAAAAIMRIDYLNQEGAFIQRNTLWFIGGAAAIASVQILDNLIKQLDDMQSLSFFSSSATTKLGDKRYTIVDYLNSSHQADELSALKTTLQTSYNFHR